MIASGLTRFRASGALRTESVVAALIAGMLFLSSLAPLVRFGGASLSLTGSDVIAAFVSLLAWSPLLAALVWLVRRPPGWKGSFVAGAHLLLFLAAPPLHAAFFRALDAVLRGQSIGAAVGTAGLAFQMLTVLGGFQYAIVLAVVHAVRESRAAVRSRLDATELALAGAQLESQLAQARNAALRAQLQPHFLFNTLNSISVMAGSDPEGAQLMIRRLSELLRAVLTGDARATVPLRRELELADAYLAIQRVRFGSRLQSRIDASPAVLDCPVPTFVLQPLVENAIQYAVASRDEGGMVTITAGRSGDKLQVTITDDGPGCVPGPGEREGLGLRNTRERLAQSYGGEYDLLVTTGPEGGCAVRVELPAGSIE